MQLYVRDTVTSVTWVEKELKGYRQLTLAPGETRTVGLTLPVAACTIVDVEVDMLTGEVRVTDLVSAVDCGKAIHPVMAEGQIEGAAIQSVGYALYERMPFDANGRMEFRSFRDYTIATAVDVPFRWDPRARLRELHVGIDSAAFGPTPETIKSDSKRSSSSPLRNPNSASWSSRT